MTIENVTPGLGQGEGHGRSLSDALMGPLISAYRVGGFGLTFLCLGTALLGGAGFVAESWSRTVMLVVGVLSILGPAYLFLDKEVRPIGRARRAVERNSELLNQIQSAALSISRTGASMQTLIFKHAQSVEVLLATSRAQLRRFPIRKVQELADRPEVSSAQQLASSIIDLSIRVEEVLRAVNAAITEADVGHLRQSLQDLAGLDTQVRALLGEEAVPLAAIEPGPSVDGEIATS